MINTYKDTCKAIKRKYTSFHRNEKTSKILIYQSLEDDPYVIGEDQKPLASVTITFPEELDVLPFSVNFLVTQQLGHKCCIGWMIGREEQNGMKHWILTMIYERISYLLTF